VNPKGLDFYERVIDALLENGIEPMSPCTNWDLPAALDDRGGSIRTSPGWFAE